MQPVIDCHTHSIFSADSVMTINDGYHAARAKRLSGITFTDHVDLDFPNSTVPFDEFDPRERDAAIEAINQEDGKPLKILRGIEIGFQSHVVEQSERFLNAYPYDMVILSVHAVAHENLFTTAGKFYAGREKNDVLKQYLEEIYASICQLPNYDVVGHIGYIQRYMPWKDKSLPYKDHAVGIDDILKKVIADKKGIEVNTSGLRNNLGHVLPNTQILQRYRELGGTIITIGSDAHQKEHVGKHFAETIALLHTLGFTHLTHFEKREPILTPLQHIMS